MFVGYVPELDLSSCGKDQDEVRRNVCDAVCGFLETSRDLGSLGTKSRSSSSKICSERPR